MPEVVLQLSHVRRLSALLVALMAMLAVATTAVADDARSTGGTTAEATRTEKPTVRQIQRALGIKADGVMGPKTRRAIRRFQKRNGLKVDGVAGPQTLKALGLLGTRARGGLKSASEADAATVLARIAECESGGDPTAVSASGTYRGKYQFSRATWRALGGTGDPAAAPENVQDMYAAALYEERGLAPWPACAEKISATAG